MKFTGHLVLAAVVISFILAVVMFKSIFDIVQVEGDQAVVQQHWKKGVLDDVLRDGTHFIFPGFAYQQYKYQIGTQKITFDSNPESKDSEYHSIEVNVGENGGQNAWIPLSVNYRLGHSLTESGPRFDAKKLVALHRAGLKDDYESIILKRTVVEVVNRIARPREALEIYSGEGYNQFVMNVEEALINHPIFRENGILIENVIVYDVALNPEYEKQIEDKQLAIQKALREKEERKAADERALRAKSEAQAEVETRTQKAEAAKQERIKAAEAEKEEQVLQAEGQKQAQILQAEGVLAIGHAEAEVEALKRESLYGGASGALRARVHMAEKQAQVLKGLLQGVQVLPEKALVALSERGDLLPKMSVDTE